MPEERYDEEGPQGDLTDLTAKASEDSNASWHPLHKTGDKATAEEQDHRANPGPVITQDLPRAEGKEELKKRAEELNKK